MIGSLGDVAFEVSSDQVRTFKDMTMTRAAKYANHDIIGGKSLLEFTGLAPAAVSLKIALLSEWGIDPGEELAAIRGMLSDHEAIDFILNGEPQGDGKWVLENLSEAHQIVDNKGKTRAVEVTLSLKEYVE